VTTVKGYFSHCTDVETLCYCVNISSKFVRRLVRYSYFIIRTTERRFVILCGSPLTGVLNAGGIQEFKESQNHYSLHVYGALRCPVRLQHNWQQALGQWWPIPQSSRALVS